MVRSTVQHLRIFRLSREFLLIGGAYYVYELARYAAADKVVDAFNNASLVVQAERAVGIFLELPLQVALLSYEEVIDLLSLWYFWGHFPLIIGVAVWAFYRQPHTYVWARNAILISGAIALVGYVLFPVAPPRLLPGAGFVDTLQSVFAPQYGDSGFVNEYAAVPSMHQGFAIILGVAFYRMVGGRAGLVLALLLPTVMLLSIVATGNHYFLDALLGAAVVVVGMTIATHLDRWQPWLVATVERRLFRRGLTADAA